MFVQIVVSAAALLANSAQAFDGTAPFLLSQSTRGSSRGSEAAATFADAVSSVPCVEATLVFAQNKAHASDLARFADSYKSLQSILDKDSSIALPYARAENPVDALLSTISEKCGAVSTTHVYKASDISFANGASPRVFIASLAPLVGDYDRQVAAASANAETMSSMIDRVKSSGLSHVVVFAASPSSQQKNVVKRSSFAANSTTLIPFKDRSFLQKYVLFNTGLFEGAIALTLVSSVSLLGVNLLRSLQTPTKFEQPVRK